MMMRRPPPLNRLVDLHAELARLWPGRSYGLSYNEIRACFQGYGWESHVAQSQLRGIAKFHGCRLRDSQSQELVRFRKVLNTAGVRSSQSQTNFARRRRLVPSIR